MKKFVYRMTGILLIAAAILGWVGSLAGAVLVWRVRPSTEMALLSSVELLERSLVLSTDLLGVADNSLEQAEKSVVLLGGAIDDVAATLQTTSEMTASIAYVVGESLGDVVVRTQEALGAMEASAKLIDNTLAFISALPLIRSTYDPTMPLSGAVADLAKSLQPLPVGLSAVERDMNSTSSSLGSMDENISGLQESILETRQSLVDARLILQSYGEIISETRETLAQFHKNLPLWMAAAVWGLTLLFVWLVIAQAGLLMQGLEMLQRDRGERPPAVPLVPAEDSVVAETTVEQ